MKKNMLNHQVKKQSEKRRWKKIAFLIILYAIIVFLLSERDNKASKNGQATKAFGPFSQRELDAMVKSTPRGVSAVVMGDTLTYTYHSASGKTNNAASFQIIGGKVISKLGSGPYSYAGSPQMFCGKLIEAIN